jgi:hypothetical protein
MHVRIGPVSFAVILVALATTFVFTATQNVVPKYDGAGGLNRPGVFGGLFPREDGAYGTTKQAFPGGT